MNTKKVEIQNELGIHVRPSGLIFQETMNYGGTILLKAKDMEMELNSIMDLLALGLIKGDNVEISVSGPDEESYCTKLADLFSSNFDFPPK